VFPVKPLSRRSLLVWFVWPGRSAAPCALRAICGSRSAAPRTLGRIHDARSAASRTLRAIHGPRSAASGALRAIHDPRSAAPGALRTIYDARSAASRMLRTIHGSRPAASHTLRAIHGARSAHAGTRPACKSEGASRRLRPCGTPTLPATRLPPADAVLVPRSVPPLVANPAPPEALGGPLSADPSATSTSVAAVGRTGLRGHCTKDHRPKCDSENSPELHVFSFPSTRTVMLVRAGTAPCIRFFSICSERVRSASFQGHSCRPLRRKNDLGTLFLEFLGIRGEKIAPSS